MRTQKLSAVHIKRIAQVGLIAKGMVYCLLGVLAFMSAFHMNGQSTNETDKTGVFKFIYRHTGGQVMLAIIAIGLICYSIWRGIQSFGDTEGKGAKPKELVTRARYLFSGAVYALVAFGAMKMLFLKKRSSDDSIQQFAEELLSKPFGQWLAGIAAVIFFAIGIYQVYYGLSEKYRKHVDEGSNSKHKRMLIKAGKFGYPARGIVWLLIGWLFFKSALHSNSSEAGDTSKAFSFLSEAAYGAYILAAVGIGVICYGLFNFIRARYENFDSKDI